MKDYEIIKKISHTEKEPHRQEDKHYLAKNRNYLFNENPRVTHHRRIPLDIIEIETTEKRAQK